MNDGAAPPGGRMNTAAVTAFVLALAAPITCLVTAPIAIVLGVVARSQIASRGERGADIALAAIIVGGVLTALGLVVLGGLWSYAQECSSGC